MHTCIQVRGTCPKDLREFSFCTKFNSEETSLIEESLVLVVVVELVRRSRLVHSNHLLVFCAKLLLVEPLHSMSAASWHDASKKFMQI